MVLSIFIYIIIFIAIIVGIVLFILHRIEKDLKEINQITKDFFKDAFKVRLFRGYNKIIESLSQEKNKPEINYCNLLNHALYSGEAPNKKKFFFLKFKKKFNIFCLNKKDFY